MTRRRAIVLLVCTIWPFIYVAVLLTIEWAEVYFDFSGRRRLWPEIPYGIIFPIHLFSMLDLWTVTIIYFVLLRRSNRIARNRKTWWVVFFLFGNIVALPLFWSLHVWRDARLVAPGAKGRTQTAACPPFSGT